MVDFEDIIGVELELSPPVDTVLDIKTPGADYIIQSDTRDRLVIKIDRGGGVIERRVIAVDVSEVKFLIEPAPLDLALLMKLKNPIMIIGEKELEFYFSTPLDFHLIMKIEDKKEILDSIYNHKLKKTWLGSEGGPGEMCYIWDFYPHLNIEKADLGTFYAVVPVVAKGDVGQCYRLKEFKIEDDEFQVYHYKNNFYTNRIIIDIDPSDRLNITLDDETIFPDAELIRDIPVNKKGLQKIIPEFLMRSGVLGG
jgi:hypothetical protein